jgi:hypothetical protein
MPPIRHDWQAPGRTAIARPEYRHGSAPTKPGRCAGITWTWSPTPAQLLPFPPHVAVWRSVRARGETKTERSRCPLVLPRLAVAALRGLAEAQARERALAGERWQDTGLVFTTHLGAALDAGNVRRMFKRVCAAAGIGDAWTPRAADLVRQLMSHRGVSIEEIARLAGHASTGTTELVYRRELRPVITTSAQIIDEIFGAAG